jgi:hypothetical protein
MLNRLLVHVSDFAEHLEDAILFPRGGWTGLPSNAL